MKRPGRLLKLLLCGMALLLAAAWFGMPLDCFAPQSRFIRHWTHTLRGSGSAAAATEAIQRNKEGGKMVHLADGSWVAVVMEHHCCTGAGFDATLYVASDGQAWLDSETCYCGFLPLDGELHEYSRQSIPAFLASVRANGKPLIRL